MQTTRNPSNTQVGREAAAARKRHPILTRRIPVRTRTAIVAKEEERRRREEEKKRRRDVAFRAASWHSSQPYQGFDVKCLREEIEQIHFRDFIADAWPGDFFRFPG